VLKALVRLKRFSRLLFWAAMPMVLPAALLSILAARLLLLGGKLGWWLADTWGDDPYDFL
jgi:hypothetical protein